MCEWDELLEARAHARARARGAWAERTSRAYAWHRDRNRAARNVVIALSTPPVARAENKKSRGGFSIDLYVETKPGEIAYFDFSNACPARRVRHICAHREHDKPFRGRPRQGFARRYSGGPGTETGASLDVDGGCTNAGPTMQGL